MAVSMTKRGGGLVLALALAALATGALISYVRGVEDEAFRGAETVHVFVARDTIPVGTSAEAAVRGALVERTQVPRKVVAEGAVASLDQIRGKVAAVTIVRGEQILASRFVLASQVVSGLPIPAGRHAMAVEVDAPPGVAGFVQPGTRVSVLAHVDVRLPNREDTEPQAKFLLQNVEVLAVGQRVALASGSREKARAETAQGSEKVLLTLAVTPSEAEKLAFALFEGDVYFTLLPQGAKPVGTAGRNNRNLFR